METRQGQVIITLRQELGNKWCLYAPKGHPITDPFWASGKEDAIRKANSYVSSFVGWTVKVADETKRD